MLKNVIISYDISDDTKRSKVSSLLEDHGQRVQYSVFECRIDKRTLDRLLIKLRPFTDESESIRVYQMCGSCLKKIIVIGKARSADQPEFFLV